MGPSVARLMRKFHGRGGVRWSGPASLIGILLWGCIPTAHSQELEEILVTAQRRQQSAQDVPISITALSGDQLRELGATSSVGVAQQTPGLILVGGATGAFNVLPTIRGVTQNDFSQHQEPPNAVYVDDAYISTTSGLAFNLFDTQRVEVLRGPQGTLFGRNATGGAIQYVTNRPTEETTGFVDAQYGSYNSTRVEAALGGKLLDRVQGRIALLYENDGPWWKNLAPPTTVGGNGDTFAYKFIGVRGQVNVDIADDVHNLVIVTRGNVPRNPEGTYKSVPGHINSLGLGYDIPATSTVNGTCPGCDFFGYRDPNINTPFESSFASVGFIQKQYFSATDQFLWKTTDAFALTSISNYQSFSYNYHENSDATPLAVAQFLSSQSGHQLSEELRLSGDTGRANWTAGVYYLDISELNGQGYDTNTLPSSPLYIYAFTVREIFPQSTSTIAGFAQADFKVQDQWTLTAGLRVNHDRKEFQSTTYVPGQAPFFVYDAANGDSTVENKTDWAAKVQADWRPQDQLLLYAGVTRGNKGPGFNALPTGALPTGFNVKFDAESLLDYETGWKWSFADKRARLNGGFYYYDYRNYQAFEYILLNTVVTNKNAKLYGSELEFQVEPGAGWYLSTGASWENGTVYDVRLPFGDIVDRAPPQTPHITANVLLRKTIPVGSGTLALQADGRYVGYHFASLSNAPTTNIPGEAIFNARVAYQPDRIGNCRSRFEIWPIGAW